MTTCFLFTAIGRVQQNPAGYEQEPENTKNHETLMGIGCRKVLNGHRKVRNDCRRVRDGYRKVQNDCRKVQDGYRKVQNDCRKVQDGYRKVLNHRRKVRKGYRRVQNDCRKMLNDYRKYRNMIIGRWKIHCRSIDTHNDYRKVEFVVRCHLGDVQ